MRTVILLFLLLCIALLPSGAGAQNVSIDAVVNGEAVTTLALQDRVSLMLRTSGIKDSPEIRQRIKGQALQMLVNEMLEHQEADNLGITLAKRDLAYAVAELEKRNHLPPGGLRKFLKQHGVEEHAFSSQLKAQVLWKKVLVRKVQPRITVSDSEVQEMMARQSPGGKAASEIYLSEIVLPVLQGQQKETESLANQLVEEIRGGKSFADIAQQFSSGSTAAKGGVVGWIKEDQLRGALREAVKKAEANSVLPPIRTEEGYHIVSIGDRRSRATGNSDTAEKITPDIAREMLAMEKIDLEAKRYLKQLRDNGFIEIRL